MNTATLNQGKLFKKYQKKIIKQTNKSISIDDSSKVTKENETKTKGWDLSWWTKEGMENSEVSEIQALTEQLDELLADYKSKHSTLINKTQEYSQVTSLNNKYSNKNIIFTTGHVCYVTSQGVVKYIPSPDIWNSFVGKNGCPGYDTINIGLPWLPEYGTPGTIVPTDPPLITGTFMTANEACGNAGQNVFVNTMIKDTTEKYVGCYRDKPENRVIDVVPLLTVANSYSPQNWESAWNQPGFSCTTSSIYMQNNDANGPYKAFDKDIGSFWHSEVSAANNYNANTGDYEGTVSFQYEKSPGVIDFAKGEWVWVKFDSAKTITQYDIVPRQDSYTYRSPSSWTIMGLNPAQNWQVLAQEYNIDFIQSGRRFNITSPGNYLAYLIVVTKVGNASAANSGNRYCVQIAEWNLYASSDASFTNEDRAMSLTNGGDYVSNPIETCKRRALDGGWKYFGIQDLQANGTAQCAISNDLYRTQIYGEANNRTWIPLWSSGTYGKATAGVFLSSDGRLLITEVGSGAILWSSPNSPASCWWGGHANPDSISGSYGGNCVGRPVGIDCGNPQSNSYPADGLSGNMGAVLREIGLSKVGNSNYTINAQEAYQKTGLPADPAVCCAKQYQYSYQCGGGPFKTGSNVSEAGGNLIFDCTAEVAECGKFTLELQDDANMCIYQGGGNAIWCTMTNGQAPENNPYWVATNGKYGAPRLTVGQVLGPNEWIGSNTGLIILIMQTDGNLVLYSSKANPGCETKNDRTYGKAWANAVYELSEQGNPGAMNKMGYVDSNGVLSEYPPDLIGKSKNFISIPNFDSPGNDFGGMPMQNENPENCKKVCGDNDNCAGFVFDRSNNNCWLKDSNMFPKGPRYENSNIDMYIRMPKIENDNSCNKNIVPIDSVSWDRYNKSGRNMTLDTTCGLANVVQPSIQTTDEMKQQIADLAAKIVEKINTLASYNTQLNKEMDKTSEDLVNNMDKYKKINEEFSKQSSSYAVNINGILSETDQQVLQQNYNYMFWSILAIGIIIIIMNMKKK